MNAGDIFAKLNETWGIPGHVANVTIHLTPFDLLRMNVTRHIHEAEAEAMVAVFSQYQLIPSQPWTWLSKPPTDNAPYVKWDPSALPPDAEEPVLYWTWDGHTVELAQWCEDVWWERGTAAHTFLQNTRIVLAWQPLTVPSAPEPRKDLA